jgi:hypothetical protein
MVPAPLDSVIIEEEEDMSGKVAAAEVGGR